MGSVVSNLARSVERSVAGRGAEQERLSRWLLFSLLVHGALVAVIFVMPSLPARSTPQYPVYSVDLVGGEKIGGMRFGTEVAPRPAKQVSKRPEADPPAPVDKAKLEAKKEKAEKAKAEKEKAEKAKVVEKAPPAKESEKPQAVVKSQAPEKAPAPQESAVLPEKPRSESEKPQAVVKAQVAEKAPPPQESAVVAEKPPSEGEKPQAATEAKAEPGDDALERVRERLIQSAVERIKSRAESAQKAAASAKNTPAKDQGGEALSSGPGEGDGAAALGQGGRGGGIVRGIEFVAYQAKLFETIRANWSWVGHRSDLRVVVRFGIKENGEIVGLRIVQPSGDTSYDDSVLRALRKSTPLPAPPEDYRREFSNVELAFRPKDLGA